MWRVAALGCASFGVAVANPVANPAANPAANLTPYVVDTLAGDPARLRLPAGSVRSALAVDSQASAGATTLRVYGLRLRVETFDSPADPQTVADTVVRQLAAPPSLLVQPGALLLAWQAGQHHWLVRLTASRRAARGGSHGTVSVLTLPEAHAPAAPAATTAPPVWLPGDARLRFALDEEVGPRTVKQFVYTHDLPPAQLWPRLHARLREDGWQPHGVGGGAGANGTGGALRFVRGPRALTLLVVATADGGSGVWVFETAG